MKNRLTAIAWMVPPLGLAFILSQFLRSVPAVIAPNLRAELDLSAAQLSALPAALFLGSALMQLPVGVLLDRFGPRRTIAAFVLVTAAGILGVAYSKSVFGLTAALLVAGWGIAPVFMGVIVLLTRWVPRDRLAQMISLAVAVSGTGMLLSASPFAHATEAYGWRATLAVVGFVSLALSVAIFVLVRDRPADAPPPDYPPESILDTVRGLGHIIADRRIYAFAGMAAFSVGSILTFRALWVGPYLNDVFALDLVDRGHVIFALSLAWLCSSLLLGPLDRRFDTRRGVVTGAAVGMAVMFTLLALNNSPSTGLVTFLLVALGLTSALSSLVFAHARALFPDRYTGRVVTVINLFVWGGVFLIQVATGALVDAFPADPAGRSPLAAYQAMFAALAAALLIALIIYRRVEDVPPSRDLADSKGAAAESGKSR